MSESPRVAASTTPHSLSALVLMGEQIECETLTLPTGSSIFQPGTTAAAIYGVARGIVETIGEEGEKICYRSGELFCYQDIAWRDGLHRCHAVARTPVEILRLDRLSFLNLLHNHPTLAIMLIRQQHDRLREQRSSGTCCY